MVSFTLLMTILHLFHFFVRICRINVDYPSTPKAMVEENSISAINFVA